MAADDYETMLTAALHFITAGPYFILNLWERLPAALHQRVAAMLATRRSFATAVGEGGVFADLVEGLAERPPRRRRAPAGDRRTGARDRPPWPAHLEEN
jgi:hypothetical protein